MTKSIKRPALVAAAAFLCLSALVLAHDPKKKSTGMDDPMQCGEHHSAAMKASEQVSIHLAEAKRAGTLAEMRTHVEAADKAMAEMKKHMHMCMEMMGEMHGGKIGAGMMGTNATAAKVVDPVCGMDVDTANAPKTTHKGQMYYFCSEDDKAKFVKNPEQYAAKKP